MKKTKDLDGAEPAAIAAVKPIRNTPKDEWTLQKGIAPGTQLALCRHLVECREIMRSEPTYDLWRVRVLGPITMNASGVELPGAVPPLLWRGEIYDTKGVFTPQRAPEGYR